MGPSVNKYDYLTFKYKQICEEKVQSWNNKIFMRKLRLKVWNKIKT